MTYAKGALSVTASLSIGLLGPSLWHTFRGMSAQKATGMGAIAGGLMEALLSPLFWIFSLAIFGLFFAAAHLKSKALSVLFFWIPSILFSGLAFLFLAMFAFIMWHFQQG